MMESGTLDFEDLMDTGDFPGFEIAKFTPATDDKENDRDGILRTPEHVREDDDDNFVVQQTKKPEKIVRENGDCDDLQAEGNGMKKDDAPLQKEKVEDPPTNCRESPRPSKQEAESSITDMPEVDFDDGEKTTDKSPENDLKPSKKLDGHEKAQNNVKVNKKPDQKGDGEKTVAENGEDKVEEIDYVVEINNEDDFVVELNQDDDDEGEEGAAVKDDQDDEPPPKRKKMSLMPTAKPKMKLWGGNNKKEKNENLSPVKVNNQSEDSTADNGMSDVTEEDKSTQVDGEEDNNPHQQSFLSFLNLQPGNSKADKSKSKSNQEKTKTEDFYSRKRLRTRKKVSYAEDVVEDIDDEYKDEEEQEEPFDHEISLPRRRRSSSGTGGRQNSFNNPAGAAVMKYAEAMKKLNMPTPLFVPQKPLVTISSMSNSPRPGPQVPQQQSTTQLYRNILPKAVNEVVEPNGNGPMKGLFECGLCGTFFSTAGQFISHQETAHNTNKQKGRSGIETFRCEVCQFVLTNRFAYLEHKRMKHSKNQITFNCNKCGSSFSYLIDLQKHKQICGLPYTYTCTHCNLQMRDLEEMTGHNAKFHPTAPVVAASPSVIPIKPVQPAAVNLNNPVASVHPRQLVACAIRHCTFKCLTQMEMKHHVQNKHNPQYRTSKNDLFQCNAPRCSKIFPTREKLLEHKREVHASEFIVQYQCMECKCCYSSKTLLAEHQYLHMMDKMKKCDICMRRFGSYLHLMKHKEVHTSKGTYRCTSCTRWCEDREELALHVCREKKQKLLGLRIYFCDICHRDFKTDEQMFQHRKEHKNYYQCSTCQWEGKEEEEYFQHREVHGLFTCRECCEEIPTEAELSTHRKAHKYYVKMEEVEEEDGNAVPVMYLCPSLMNAVKTETITA